VSKPGCNAGFFLAGKVASSECRLAQALEQDAEKCERFSDEIML
jgi:hypothetical protein